MSLSRTIFPASVAFGALTFDKNEGGPIRATMSITAQPVLDETGDDLTFSFLAYHTFINGLELVLHDNNVLSQLYIGQSGLITVTLDVPDNVSPIEGEEIYPIPLGTGYVMGFEPGQSFGSVNSIVVHFLMQPLTRQIGGPIVE